MTISWKQVLEIETFWNRLFDQNVTFERLLWRHPQTIKSGLRVDQSKRYTFNDLQHYLTSKFPDDEMLRKGTEVTMQLFQTCAAGERLCEIDEELLDINENQDNYKLSAETLKYNLLCKSAEYTGSTSFFLFCLKAYIDSERNFFSKSQVDNKIKEQVTRSFLGYIKQLGNINPEYFGFTLAECACDFVCSEFIKGAFQNLLEKTDKFMNDSRFKAYISSCEKNNYSPPYYITERESFFNDTISFSINEVLEIINQDSGNYFAFKLRHNESMYPEDMRISQYGNLNIFITLSGLMNFSSITDLKNRNELLPTIKKLLSTEFAILPRESINDYYNPDETVSGNRMDSTLIIGRDLIQEKLYNQYIDAIHEKVIKGFVWFHDDVNGIIYDYLGFSDTNDYKGEYKHSMPFENVIYKYFIAYLEKTRWEREMENDLKNEGYWYSKNEYERELEDGYEENDGDDLNHDNPTWDICPVCDARPGEFCRMSDPQNCPFGRGID